MHALITLHARIFGALETYVAPVLVPTLARFLFAAILLVYYWNSGLTKLGDGLFGFLSPGFGAYGQILPRVFEASGYDLSQIGAFPRLVVLVGTWAEFILPVAILIGLFTRLAALGMVGFVVVQSYVDIVGHNLAAADIGAWFDGNPSALILDQRAFWVFLLTIIVLRGAGPLSVDAILGRRHKSADLTAAVQPR
jgi:putative oxidoreductase